MQSNHDDAIIAIKDTVTNESHPITQFYTDVTFLDDSEVRLIKSNVDDESVAMAAWVSTYGVEAEDRLNDKAKVKGLINYLMREKHETPFENAGSMLWYIKTPMDIGEEHLRHRIGWCLSGDTKIPVGTQRNGSVKTIEKIYSDWKNGVTDCKGRTRFLKSTQNLMTRSINLDTGLYQYEKMIDVVESGVKPLIRLTLKNGMTLKCTKEHQIWTPDGWDAAGELTVGDIVGRIGQVSVGDKVGIPRRLREGIQFWTTEQRQTLISEIDRCYVCQQTFTKDLLELDHVIPVYKDISKSLDVNNLKPACGPCHQTKTNSETSLNGVSRRRPQTLGTRFEKLVAIDNIGEEMTYDISMPAPHHNFIANGFIVHNSFNKISGRYAEFPPEFYLPPTNRPLLQHGKVGQYTFEEADMSTVAITRAALMENSQTCWTRYMTLKQQGVANEVARWCLPSNIMTQYYTTCNPRSLMHFLNLRMAPNAKLEIQNIAKKMAVEFERVMPITYNAWKEQNDNDKESK